MKLTAGKREPSLRYVDAVLETNIAKLEELSLATKLVTRTVLKAWICGRQVDASRECEKYKLGRQCKRQ